MFEMRPREKKTHVKQNYEYREPYLMDHVVSTGKADTDFYVNTDIHFKDPVDMVSRIRAFENDVGVENVKRLSGPDFDNLVKEGRFSSKQKGFIDSTMIPKTAGEREKVAKELDGRTSKLWKSLPKELKGSLSLEEFCRSFKPEWLDRIPVPETKKEGDK